MPLNLSIPFEKKFTFSFVYRPLQSFVSQLKAHERIDCLNSHIREEQKKENTSCHFIPIRRPVQTHSIEKNMKSFSLVSYVFLIAWHFLWFFHLLLTTKTTIITKNKWTVPYLSLVFHAIATVSLSPTHKSATTLNECSTNREQTNTHMRKESETL